MHVAPVAANGYVSLVPPSRPLKDAAKRAAPAPDHPDLSGEQIENTTVPNPDVDGMAAANKRSLPNPLNSSLPMMVVKEDKLILSPNGSCNLPREI